MTAEGESGLARDAVVAANREWLEKAVIGLRLCPFAERVHRRGQVRYRVSAQVSGRGLVRELADELRLLHAADPLLHETSLLITRTRSKTSTTTTNS